MISSSVIRKEVLIYKKIHSSKNLLAITNNRPWHHPQFIAGRVSELAAPCGKTANDPHGCYREWELKNTSYSWQISSVTKLITPYRTFLGRFVGILAEFSWPMIGINQIPTATGPSQLSLGTAVFCLRDGLLQRACSGGGGGGYPFILTGMVKGQ